MCYKSFLIIFALLSITPAEIYGWSWWFSQSGMSFSDIGKIGKSPDLKHQKLLLIMLDGCRWDYVNNDDHPGFKRLTRNGVKAEYLRPIFPSNSYPNWLTIVTGLYPETHGVIQNYMYNEEKNQFFLMGAYANGSEVHWWNASEPVWISAENRGMPTAMYRWDGCQFEINGKKVAHCEKYDPKRPYNSKLEVEELRRNLKDAVLKFSTGLSHFALVYHDSIDNAGHKFGPDALETKEEVKRADEILDELQTFILEKSLQNNINIIVLSDHGMASSVSYKEIDLEKYVSINDIRFLLDRDPFAMIQPESGSLGKVYDNLKQAKIEGLKVFLKDELPESFHLRTSKLVLPIIITVEKGFKLKKLSDESKQISPKALNRGDHGYLPDEVTDMRAIFFAKGPAFKQGFQSGPIEMVDVYNLMCYLLNMTPNPNNGTWSHVEPMLSPGELTYEDWITTTLLIGLIALVILALSYKFLLSNDSKKKQS